MIEKKYLDDIITFDDDIQLVGNKQKVFIIAGVGAGKSSWVMKDLPIMGIRVLFITSRRTKKDADLFHNDEFTDDLNMDYLDEFDKKSCLVTYAKLYSFLKEHWLRQDEENNDWDIDKWLRNFHMVVIDEVHCIMSDSAFADGTFMLQKFMEYAAEKMTVVAMTGTPRMIKDYFMENDWIIRDYSDECTVVKPKKYEAVMNDAIPEIIKNALSEGQQIVYFVNRKDSIPEHIDGLLKNGVVEPSQIGAIVSTGKDGSLGKALEGTGITDNEIISTSEAAYSGITSEKHQIPSACRILFSTSRMKEGIDIYNKNCCPIIESHNWIDIVQYSGRFRKGLSTVYIITNARQLPLLENYKDYADIQVEYEKETFLLDGLQKYYDKNDDSDSRLENGIMANDITKDEYRFPFLRFNYITKKWEIFELKDDAICKNQDYLSIWDTYLEYYCQEYRISFKKPKDKRKQELEEKRDNLVDDLTDKGYLNKKLFLDQKKEAVQIIKEAYPNLPTDQNEARVFLTDNHAPIKIFVGEDRVKTENGKRSRRQYLKVMKRQNR